ncbi:MAG: selenocysteine-specific translation elongation factor [Nitrospiraceae bacterium]|nr:MAG: selenocysteine-specific translation elongation factor [Nitrospiraceae bacterium]
MRYVILGTAGHIDHGKSALVKALTGIDPDRLKEEKERGITIDLGFASLTYRDGLSVGIVDVPGHEKLIKNMLAGAGGIDLVMLVIAADEGVMPQSREHLAICDLLKIKKGIVAITKSDLVDKEWLELISEDVKNLVKETFLDDAEIVTVSSKTGQNLDVLREKIRETASGIDTKTGKGIFRLPIDRVFTMKGFGTVVTGTALSGTVSVDSYLEILPAGLKTKVRGLQSHGKGLKTAQSGQRVSINLQGIEKQEIKRGDVLTAPGKIQPSSVIDAHVELLKDTAHPVLRTRSLVHFHTGTSELIGRVVLYDREELKPGEAAYCQFRLQGPVTVLSGDRYIIRRFSPLLTIGGGEILDPLPRRRKKIEGFEDLRTYGQGNLEEKLSIKILHSGMNGMTLSSLEGWIKAELPEIHQAVEKLVHKGELISIEDRIFHISAFNVFSRKILSLTKTFHDKNPLRPGIPKERLRAAYLWLDQRLFDGFLTRIQDIYIEREIIKLKTFKVALTKGNEIMKQKILKALLASAFQPLTKEELSKKISVKGKEIEELLKLMAVEGSLVRINDTIFIPSENYKKMVDSLKAFFKTKPEMTVGEFRDILGTSRKYALPFLEYLDSNKITLRVGEVRKLLIK